MAGDNLAVCNEQDWASTYHVHLLVPHVLDDPLSCLLIKDNLEGQQAVRFLIFLASVLFI